jgi:hypothetical protein
MEYLLLIVFFSGTYNIANKINLKIFKTNNDEILDIFSISIIFLIIYLINSYQLILNIKVDYANYLVFIIICLSSFFYITDIIKKKTAFIFKKFNYYLLVIFFLYFILLGFPVAEEDSLRYHLPIAKKILNNNFFDNYWLDYITISSQEFINVLFLCLNTENGSSIINFIFLMLYFKAAIYFYKNNNLCNEDQSNLLILLSSPYLVSLLTSQKLYFMPSFLVTLVFVYLYLNARKIDNYKLHLMGFVITFCFVTKATFVPYFILFYISIIWLKKNIKNILHFYFYHFITFIIIYIPILYIKYKIFNDPFIPFISLNSENIEWYKEYKFSLTAWEMDFTDNIKNNFLKLIITPIKLIIPLSLSDIFKCLGIGVIFVFSLSQKNKYVFLLILFFFLNIFLLLNTQTRWFLPFLILISFLSTFRKNQILSKIIKVQSIAIISVLVPLALITLLYNFKIINADKVINKFQSSAAIIKEVNKITKGNKVFTNINHWYKLKNYVPIYYPKLSVMQNKNIYLDEIKNNDYALWEDKSFDIKDLANEYLHCNEYKLVKSFMLNNTRNFLLEKEKSEFNLYQLTKCQ